MLSSGGQGVATKTSHSDARATEQAATRVRQATSSLLLRRDVNMPANIDILQEDVLTVTEVADRLRVKEDTVRRLFLHEPGVLVICRPRKGHRLYRTLRIPKSVFERVLTRFTRLA